KDHLMRPAEEESPRRAPDLAPDPSWHHLPLRGEHGGGPRHRPDGAGGRDGGRAGGCRGAPGRGAGPRDSGDDSEPPESARLAARVKPEDRFVRSLRTLLPGAAAIRIGP